MRKPHIDESSQSPTERLVSFGGNLDERTDILEDLVADDSLSFREASILILRVGHCE